MDKKKIISVFISDQSVDYYEYAGYFDELSSKYNSKILKLDSIKSPIGEEVINLPLLDFNSLTDFLKYVKEKATLRWNDKVFENKNHKLYAQFRNNNGSKAKLKFILVNLLSFIFASKTGIQFLEKILLKNVKKSNFYTKIHSIFKEEKPDFIYITHQSTSYSLGVSTAAKELHIPVVCFIYSWDNIVKGNKLVVADYYFVWSEFMQKELLKYYRNENIILDKIHVVGTPQFHPYFELGNEISQEVFKSAYKIPQKDYYICFSGNFTAIGQDDPAYLIDLAEEVKKYNQNNKLQFHILLRANPADYNKGFKQVTIDYSDVITDVNANWSVTGKEIPVDSRKINLAVLKATIKCSDVMVNVGSTMALDATLLNKLAYYIDYKIEGGSRKFKIDEIYKFLHLKNLEQFDNPIKHIRSKEGFLEIFEDVLINNSERLLKQKFWAKNVVKHPINDVVKRMMNAYQKIEKECI